MEKKNTKKMRSCHFIIIILLLNLIACTQQNSRSGSLQIEGTVNEEKLEYSIPTEIIVDEHQDFNDEAIKMLKNFYTIYLNESCDGYYNENKIDSLLKDFTTENLRQQINDPDIDWDMLIDGQFCEKEWLDNMSINADSATGTNNFIIVFEYYRQDYEKNVEILIQKRIKFV